MDIKTMHLDKDDILMIHGYFTEEGAERIKATLKEIGIENKVLFAPLDVEMTVLKKGKAEGEAKVEEQLSMKQLVEQNVVKGHLEELEKSIAMLIRLAENPEQAAEAIVQIFKESMEKVASILRAAGVKGVSPTAKQNIVEELKKYMVILIRLTENPEQAAKVIVQIFKETLEKVVKILQDAVHEQ